MAKKKSFIQQLFSNPNRQKVADASAAAGDKASVAERVNLGNRGEALKKKRKKKKASKKSTK